MYEKPFFAGWGDMDFNSHMRNTAYLDRSADVRMMFFSEHGFPMSEFVSRRIGPVIMKETLEYFREVALLEPIKITLSVAALADDGSRFEIVNELFGRDRAVFRFAIPLEVFVVVIGFGVRLIDAHLFYQIGASVSPKQTGDFLITFEVSC